MIDFLMLLACVLTRLFRSRARLEAEILVLRHQLNILQRKSTKRAAFKSIDRLVFAGRYRLVPGMLDALKILKPETVIRWHRAGYYNDARTHLSLNKDAPASRCAGRWPYRATPHLGGLHHQYVRI